MSGASAPPSDGVVRSSALSFLASAQPPGNTALPKLSEDQHGLQGSSGNQDRVFVEQLIPGGVAALCEACALIYPDQPNPLQLTTRLKYWLGGQDPLDYISMYWNPGRPDLDVPPHWHYISFGLSDLHGDGRVHAPAPGAGAAPGASGFGFELTFRLRSELSKPPLWPAALLQATARYVFATGNKLCNGDHISWHSALDAGSAESGRRSRVRHLLVTKDPQLDDITSPHGTVSFLQIVGCTARELRAAQRGSGFEVLKLMSQDKSCGGPWLLTCTARCRSALGCRPKMAATAAHLAGVSARLHVSYTRAEPEEAASSKLSPSVEEQIKETLQRGLTSMAREPGDVEGHMSTDSFEMSSLERALPSMSTSEDVCDDVVYPHSVHLVLNAEGASLLPLAIDGRVRHDRHFTWRDGFRSVTFLSARVSGAMASERRPYALRGGWLQVLIPKSLAEDMSSKVAQLSSLADSDSESDDEEEGARQTRATIALPLALAWPEHRLQITVVSD